MARLTTRRLASRSSTSTATGTVSTLWSGALRATGFTSQAKTSGATTARLAASTSSTMTSPVYSTRVTPDAQGMVKATVHGLAPNTQYWYCWELGAGLYTSKVGQVKTAPVGNASFTFMFGSCDNGGGVANTYSRGAARNPLFFFSPGDLFYGDIITADATAFRTKYNTQLTASGSAPFHQAVPLVYSWSDHDFSDNNSVGTSGNGATVRSTVQAVYRQYVPHYPLISTDGGIYQTFVIGRVRVILTDNRSYKSLQTNTDNSSKTVLGTAQKQWFKDLVTAATEPLILWFDDQPWTNMAGADDEWPNYSTEQTELANHITTSGKNVIFLGGDMHALAADNGTNSAGGLTVFQAAPIDNTSSIKGTYTAGPWPSSGSSAVKQYAMVTVTDSGTSIAAAYTGYDTSDVARVTLTKTFSTGVTATQVAQPSGPGGTWSLRFSDDFTGTTLSTANWTSGVYPWGDPFIATNQEQEWYDPSAVTISSGTCKLTASVATNGSYPGRGYKSGLIHSQGRFDFVYGFVEARLKCPTALGTWPAFWLAPSDVSWPPEIDILEAYGTAGGTEYETNYFYPDGSGGAVNTGSQAHAATISSFNVYGMQWSPTSIVYYLNGSVVRTITTGADGAQNVPMYVILNLAVASADSPDNAPIAGSYPQVMEIDYVRVWEG